jgi:hypothetical protein
MFVEGRNYEQRNQCTRQLIADVVSKFQVPDFGWTIVNTDDMDLYKTYFGYRVLCFSTFNGDFSQTVPDFTYGGWPEVGIDSFEGTCASMEAGGMDPYAMNAIGWRGALTHYNRRLIVQMRQTQRGWCAGTTLSASQTTQGAGGSSSMLRRMVGVAG